MLALLVASYATSLPETFQSDFTCLSKMPRPPSLALSLRILIASPRLPSQAHPRAEIAIAQISTSGGSQKKGEHFVEMGLPDCN